MSKTILVVEDDHDLAKVMCRLLKEHNYEVLHAADGEAGVEMAHEHVPDLALLDIKMPKKDGELVAVELRGSPKTAGIAIMMMTAVTNISDKHLIAQLGIRDYIEKPFDPDVLIAKVGEVLARSSSS
jgi:DNA-binding response OmpR family regulator